jgi:hypothetical protein
MRARSRSGDGEQILALAGALVGLQPTGLTRGGEGAVAADDEPLARELGRGNAGHLAVPGLRRGRREQRHLQGAAFEQRLEGRSAQGGDPVEPGRFSILGNARLGDHAPVADQDDVVETEALLQLGHSKPDPACSVRSLAICLSRTCPVLQLCLLKSITSYYRWAKPSPKSLRFGKSPRCAWPHTQSHDPTATTAGIRDGRSRVLLSP